MFTQETKKHVFTQDLCKNVQSRFTHNNLKMETAQVSINRWLDKLRCVHKVNIPQQQRATNYCYTQHHNTTLSLWHTVLSEKDQNSSCLWEWLRRGTREFSGVTVMVDISTRLTCKNSSNGTCAFSHSTACTSYLKKVNTDLQLVILMSTPYFEMHK